MGRVWLRTVGLGIYDVPTNSQPLSIQLSRDSRGSLQAKKRRMLSECLLILVQIKEKNQNSDRQDFPEYLRLRQDCERKPQAPQPWAWARAEQHKAVVTFPLAATRSPSINFQKMSAQSYSVAASYYHWLVAAPLMGCVGSVLKCQQSPKVRRSLAYLVSFYPMHWRRRALLRLPAITLHDVR